MELAKDHHIDIVKIDTKENKYIPGQFTVFVVPTVLLIYRGEEILRESRFIDFNRIEKSLYYIEKNENIE